MIEANYEKEHFLNKTTIAIEKYQRSKTLGQQVYMQPTKLLIALFCYATIGSLVMQPCTNMKMLVYIYLHS